MTAEEAKSIIEENFELTFDAVPASAETETKKRQALAVAIEALEKQIPKKPDESFDGYADGYPVMDYYCPNCGKEVEVDEHHCICGQSIDWSDYDD